MQKGHISQWRRTICGDLTAAFSPWNGSKPDNITFLDRDRHVEDIYNAQFKQPPTGYRKLSGQEIAAGLLSGQEKGVRPSCALPYELYADGRNSADGKQFDIKMAAGNVHFGNGAAGAPFTVCAPGKFSDGQGEISRNWSFALKAGDALTYSWPLDAFENSRYDLRLYGVNGFYREFRGDQYDPAVIHCGYQGDPVTKKATGNIVLSISAPAPASALRLDIVDNAYKKAPVTKEISAGAGASIALDLKASYGWYDFTIRIRGLDNFERRYAGRVETGSESFSDPSMGGI